MDRIDLGAIYSGRRSLRGTVIELCGGQGSCRTAGQMRKDIPEPLSFALPARGIQPFESSTVELIPTPLLSSSSPVSGFPFRRVLGSPVVAFWTFRRGSQLHFSQRNKYCLPRMVPRGHLLRRRNGHRRGGGGIVACAIASARWWGACAGR